MTTVISHEVDKDHQESRAHSMQGTSALLDIEPQFERGGDELCRNMMVLQLLASMSESLGPECLKQATQILQFVKVRFIIH